MPPTTLTADQIYAIQTDPRHQKVIAKDYGIGVGSVYYHQRKAGLVYPYRPEDQANAVNPKGKTYPRQLQ
jgi:hypothetical protein